MGGDLAPGGDWEKAVSESRISTSAKRHSGPASARVQGPARPENDPRFRAIFEAVADGLLLYDLGAGRIVSANGACLEMLGYSLAELTGLTLDRLHEDQDLRFVQARLAEARAGANPLGTDLPFRRKDGTEFLAEMRPNLLTLGGRRCVLVTLRDVTTLRRAESELALQAAMVKDLSEGVYLIRARDGAIVYANPRLEALFGYGPGELMGRHVSVVNANAEQSPEETAREIALVLERTGEWHGEIQNVRKDGTRLWCSASVSAFDHPDHGRVWISIHQDITAHKQAEEALQESEERYRSLVDGSLDAVLLTRPGGHILSANRAATEMFGRSEQELIRLGRDAVFDASLPANRRALAERANRGWFRGVLMLRRADGTSFPGEISSVVFENVRGEARSSMVIRDLTERLAAEQRLREQKDELARLERAARTSAIASSVAHELTQPLTGILSSAQAARRLLDGRRPDLDEVRQALDDIIDDGRRAAGFMASVREMIRQGRPTRRPTELNAIVVEAIRLSRSTGGGAGSTVRARLARALPPVLVDPLQIQQVILNLLANARQATADSATPADVTVSTACHPDQGVVVSVSDRGPGIAAADLERVFDAFFTSRAGGLGLGLAISRAFVEANGGTIRALRRSGGGATVRFVLPTGGSAQG
jgi:PAS domain S-box-containing protein